VVQTLRTFSQPVRGDASICYSGGLDSTSVAYFAANQQQGRVHLLTLDHGYGYLFNRRWSRRTSRSLAGAIGPDRVVHRIVDTHALHRRLGIRSLLRDRLKYGQWFGCCLSCTMAMVTEAIVYNLRNGVPHLMMGSSVGGQYAVMSMPGTVALLKAYCGDYGITYSTPLLDDVIVKAQERAALEEAGVVTGIRFLDKHSFGNQGYCMLSLQHLPDVLFNAHPEYDPGSVERFFLDKLPICRRHVEESFGGSAQNLESAVDRLASHTPTGEPR